MANKEKKQGAPEFAGEMGEVQPIGRKGGAKADKKDKNKAKKKKQ